MQGNAGVNHTLAQRAQYTSSPNLYTHVSSWCTLSGTLVRSHVYYPQPSTVQTRKAERLISLALPATLGPNQHVHGTPVLAETTNAAPVLSNAVSTTRIGVGTMLDARITNMRSHRCPTRRSTPTKRARPVSRVGRREHERGMSSRPSQRKEYTLGQELDVSRSRGA